MVDDDLKPLAIEVVYATPQEQTLHRLRVKAGTTLEDAIRTAGLGKHLDDAALRIGVFGRLASPTDAVGEGDRIELYRELLADPKATRRRRAAQKKIRGDARPG